MNNYVFHDEMKKRIDQTIDECIKVGLEKTKKDQRHNKYPCNSFGYHWGNCCYIRFDEMYKKL